MIAQRVGQPAARIQDVQKRVAWPSIAVYSWSASTTQVHRSHKLGARVTSGETRPTQQKNETAQGAKTTI